MAIHMDVPPTSIDPYSTGYRDGYAGRNALSDHEVYCLGWTDGNGDKLSKLDLSKNPKLLDVMKTPLYAPTRFTKLKELYLEDFRSTSNLHPHWKDKFSLKRKGES